MKWFDNWLRKKIEGSEWFKNVIRRDDYEGWAIKHHNQALSELKAEIEKIAWKYQTVLVSAAQPEIPQVVFDSQLAKTGAHRRIENLEASFKAHAEILAQFNRAIKELESLVAKVAPAISTASVNYAEMEQSVKLLKRKLEMDFAVSLAIVAGRVDSLEKRAGKAQRSANHTHASAKHKAAKK